MSTTNTKGIGLRPFHRNSVQLSGPVRSGSFQTRPVCRPLLLAPRPRTPRRQRRQLVTTNFKQSDDYQEEAPVMKPKTVRHPLTEDKFAGAGPAETATQEVIFSPGPAAAAAAAAPKAPSFMGSMAQMAQQTAHLLSRPRALLRALVRNSAAYGLPLLLAYLARQPLMSFWAFYCSSLDSYPLLTKIATGVVGTAIGDYVAQRLSHQTELQAARLRGEPSPAFVFDITRTSRLAVYGALVGTPIGHAWFNLLDTRIMPDAMTSAQAVLTKMTLDQLLMCPLATALFFVVMRSWEGHSNDAVQYMRGKLGPTLKANYVLWPIAHIINFAFVPPAQRILYCNAVGIVWTVILSTILNSKTPPAPGAAVAAEAFAGGPGPSPGGTAPPSGGGSHGRTGASGGAKRSPNQPADMVPSFAASGINMNGGSSGAGLQADHLQTVVGGRAPPTAAAAAAAYMRRPHTEAPAKDA